MKKRELCFVGAGTHATRNIYPSALLAGAQIEAIATRHLEGAQKALLDFGSNGRAYDNVEDMLAKESCKNVIVITQAPDTPALVCRCLKAGKNVFTDKPLGMNLAEAQEAAAIAKENNSLLMVGFMKRFAPTYVRLKEFIDSQELGTVRSFRAFFAVDATSWNQTPKDFIYWVVIHYLDLIRHLFGEPEELTGFLSAQGELGLSQCISIRMKNGIIGTIAFENRSAWSREYETLDVTFQDGFVRAEDLTRLTVHRSRPIPENPWRDLTESDEIYLPNAAPMSGTTRDLFLRGFAGEMEHFLTCCETGMQPVSNGEDNVKTTIFCEQVLTQLQ